jgi:hypothetical protein
MSVTLPEISGPVSGRFPRGKATRQRARGPLWQLKNTADEQELLRHARILFDIAYRNRINLTNSWSEYYSWARGHVASDTKRPKWRSRAKSNYLFSNLFNKTALATDQRPRLAAIPREDGDTELVRTRINPFLRWVWDKTEMETGFMETMAAALLFGTAFIKPSWDPSASNGRGDIVNDWVDPSFIWPDPGATDEQDGEFFWHVQPMALDRIGRLFPQRGHLVEPEDIPLDFFSTADRLRFGRWHVPVDRKPDFRSLPSIISNFIRRGGHQEQELATDIDRAMVYELWVKDDAKLNLEVPDPRDPDGERLIQTESVYPKGRHIVFAGNQLLTPMDDQQSPYENGLFPFVRFRDYLWPNEFWGGGEIEQTKDIQAAMDDIRRTIADHFKTFANGKWIADENSVNDEEVFSNNPLQIIWKRRGSEVRRETGLPLPQGNIDMMAFLQGDMENIAGNNDVNQGRIPERISSGKAIELVTEAANSRVRLTERLAGGSLKRLLYMWVTLGAQHYTTERIVRVSGDPQPGESGERFVGVSGEDLRRGFDYEAAIGSQINRGINRLSVDQAINLFKIGTFDHEEILDAIDHPNKRALLARIKGRKEEILNLANNDPDFAQALGAAIQSAAGNLTGDLGVIPGGAGG